MKTKRIVFTGAGKAELIECEINDPEDNEVLVETEYTAISAGTERANLMGMKNLGNAVDGGTFPKTVGYSGVGIVKEIGCNVKNISIDERVLVFWGTHSQYLIAREEKIISLKNYLLDPKHAVFTLIASFSAAGVRKTKLEFGESAMVFGFGILGAFAVQLTRIAGAYPVIAADLSAQRRQLALDLGADFAFDPSDSDFTEKVKNTTHGNGVKVIIEVTGQSVALKQALECAAPFGRIALLGCTRVSDTAIDFYQQVHRPGTEIIGAHTNARPRFESRPHCWTERDDCFTLLDFMTHGRIDMSKILSGEYSPLDAPTVYNKLAENIDFPVGAVFDWKGLME